MVCGSDCIHAPFVANAGESITARLDRLCMLCFLLTSPSLYSSLDERDRISSNRSWMGNTIFVEGGGSGYPLKPKHL